MIHEEVLGRLFVLEKIYEMLMAHVDDIGGDLPEGKTLDDMSMKDFARIVAEHDFDIDQINLDDLEQVADDFWMGAQDELTEFRAEVEFYRKYTAFNKGRFKKENEDEEEVRG